MTLRPFLAAAVALLTFLSTALATDFAVSNLAAAQHPWTNLVVAGCDVADATWELTHAK